MKRALARRVLSRSHMHRTICFVMALGGCGTGGALAQAELAGECEGQAGCVDELGAGPLAAGGSVSATIRIDTEGVGTAALDLLPVDPAIIDIGGYKITGRAPGMSAVIVLERTSGSVVDFFHLYVVEPDRLELTRLGGVGAGSDLVNRLELLVGDEVTLGVMAFRGPQRLAGTAPVEWSLAGDSVSLLADGNPERRRAVARAPGTSVVEVAAMGLFHAIEIAVQP